MPRSDESSRVPTFSRATLTAFEDAAASVVLRGIERAFAHTGIRPTAAATGDDAGGARRTAFRRYVAGVDQRDPLARDRLGDALGALLAEVAESKVAFLVQAAERDGFVHARGTFRAAGTVPASFAVSHVEELGTIGEYGRRLRLLANERPAAAVAGARSLLASTCRTIAPGGDAAASDASTDLVELVRATLAQLDVRGDLVRCVAQTAAVVALARERTADVTSRHARLAVEIAASLALFVAESYDARFAAENERDD